MVGFGHNRNGMKGFCSRTYYFRDVASWNPEKKFRDCPISPFSLVPPISLRTIVFAALNGVLMNFTQNSCSRLTSMEFLRISPEMKFLFHLATFPVKSFHNVSMGTESNHNCPMRPVPHFSIEICSTQTQNKQQKKIKITKKNIVDQFECGLNEKKRTKGIFHYGCRQKNLTYQ